MGDVIDGLFSPYAVEARAAFEQHFVHGRLAKTFNEHPPGERRQIQSAFELGYVLGCADADHAAVEESES